MAATVGAKVKALYDYNATQTGELTFKFDDVITITAQDDPGWWTGELRGTKGLFPSNYVSGPIKGGPPPPRSNSPPARDAAPASVAVTVSAAPEKKAEPAKEGEARPKNSRTKFGYWGSNLAVYSAISGIFFGFCGIVWTVSDMDRFPADQYAARGAYTMIISIAVLVYEHYLGQKRNPSIIPVRFIGYLAISIYMFGSEPSLTVAVFFLVVALVQLVAALLREEYDAPKKNDSKKAGADLINADGCLDSFLQWVLLIKEQNEVGLVIFMALFWLANFLIFFMVLAEWIALNQSLPINDRLSDWGPFAKAFGNLLDFNCSIILLPVLRTMLRWMYNRSTSDQGCFAKFLRFLLLFVPIDRNISFHKLIAKLVLFASFGHTLMHFVNYANAPRQTLRLFGLWPWISGGLILLCMLMIYSTVLPNTKTGQFEIFWYNHHFFLGFFIFILSHGGSVWTGFNPNFWKWFMIPGALYIFERMMRLYRASKPVALSAVTIMRPNVFSLEFAKEGVFAHPYKDGQYIFIQCPPVSHIQWHPFTISSAPEEKTVSVHIRQYGPNSWTGQVLAYVSSMGPKGQSYFQLTRSGPNGSTVPGKIVGPDGRTMFCLDGPHSAPTQHVSEYETVMVVGAGIGVTPVAATLKSVVFHRWKYSMGKTYPNSAYFVWVCSHSEIDSFRFFLRWIKDAVDEVHHMRTKDPENMKDKGFAIHCYITSCPKDPKPAKIEDESDIGFWGPPREERKLIKSVSSFTEADLYIAMKNPKKDHQQFEDVHIWNGRPKWKARFDEVRNKHPNDADIGVTFCGPPMIAKDLAQHCHIASKGRKGIFKLHKENF